jgi:fibronectin type 3 domain-containing protein
VTNGTAYYYVVCAVNVSGDSADSAEAAATPDPTITTPAVPMGLAATAGNAQVSLTWSASSTATSYHLKRATTSGGPYTQIAAPTSTAYTDTSVTNGTTYYYVVSALDSAGESVNSAQASALPVAPTVIPATPTGLSATPGNASVALTWSASSGATGYNVKRATTSGGPYTQIAAPTTASYTDTAVTNGTTYYYVVSALDSAGASANSTQVNALPSAPVTIPATPTGLSATSGNASVALTWSATSGATAYHVKRGTTSSGPYTQIAAPTTASYTDTAVTNGTNYYYVVSALDSAGESANSAAVSATPSAPPVVAPGSITSISPTSGGAGTQVVVTGTNLAGVIPASQCGNPYCSGLTIVTAGRQTGTVYDGALTVLSNTEVIYTVPADGATGQLFLGNNLGIAYAPILFTFIPTMVPAAPPALSQISGNAEVDLSWTPVPNGASYNVWRSTTSGGGYTNIANVANASIYSDVTVSNGTTYYYVVTAADVIGNSGYSPQVTANPVLPSTENVTIAVTSSSTQSISPYIYGVNGASPLSNQFPSGTSSALPTGLTLDRFGGDRLTAYNWTTNASNAGSDYLYENDSALNTSPNSPGSAVSQRVTFDRSNGMATLMTFPMQGLVAADEAGPVSVASPPEGGRFDAVQYAKGSAFTTSPPLTGTVYDDEFAYNINSDFSGQGIFSSSPATQPVFGQLDNEPDLWSSTHLETQTSTPISTSAFITKTISLATALKRQYPQMVIFGPVNWGWSGVQSWQGAISGITNTSTNWFIDQYAQALAAASSSFGAPLVNVYDFHWYPQVVDSVSGDQLGSLNSAPLASSQTQLIVQWPRSLYDPTYIENSWLPGTIGNNAIDALPRFQAKLAADNPGMKLAITEYFPGGGGTIAGTIAEADLLGAFGANGLFAANLWPLTASFPYVTAGFRAFRNFDGAGSNFGNTAVASSSSSIANVAAYVSTDTTRPGRVVMVLINRSNAIQATTISGQPLSGTAHFFQMDAATAASQTTVQPVASGTETVSGSSLTVNLPALSVTIIDIY